MFDCVMPTRAGRHGLAYTRRGKVNLRNARHADDPRPLDEESDCPAARDYSRAYLHHLVKSGEALGAMLLTWNNVAYYQQLMQDDARRDRGPAVRRQRRRNQRRLGAGRSAGAVMPMRREFSAATRAGRSAVRYLLPLWEKVDGAQRRADEQGVLDGAQPSRLSGVRCSAYSSRRLTPVMR